MIHPTQRPMPRIHSLARARLVPAILPTLLLAGLCVANVHAQPAEKLLKAKTILDKYVEVTGGKAAVPGAAMSGIAMGDGCGAS